MSILICWSISTLFCNNDKKGIINRVHATKPFVTVQNKWFSQHEVMWRWQEQTLKIIAGVVILSTSARNTSFTKSYIHISHWLLPTSGLEHVTRLSGLK